MGLIVNGFEIHCNATIKGKLALKYKATKKGPDLNTDYGEREIIIPQKSAGLIELPLNDQR